MKPKRNDGAIRVALRAYTERLDQPHRAGSPRKWSGWRQHVLVLDTETTVDELQSLKFGCYRHYEWQAEAPPVCLEEGLLYADDLASDDPAGFAVLEAYAKDAVADTSPGQPKDLLLMSKTEFLAKVFYPLAYQAQALVVGFNLTFDIMRLAATWGEGRGKFYGGFSAVLWQAKDNKTGQMIENRWRPRLLLKLLDSKRAFIQFARPMTTDPRDREASKDENGKRVFTAFRGHFLDARTLAFAQTSESFTLEQACLRFGVAHPKQKVLEHGRITPEYIDYCRRDVLSTAELTEKLADEFDRHPIGLDPCKAYSPASIAKAYMRSMGVKPPFEKFSDLPKELYGIAMAAYYGGRAECHIRKMPVEVMHTDFISMYPTVNSLMGLWDIVTAAKLSMEDCTEDAQRFLDQATLNRWFDPAPWRDLAWFGEIEPDGDILPVRGEFAPSSGALNIAVSELTSSVPLWYSGPDLVASALNSGKAPRLKRAVKLSPSGKQDGLTPVKFAGVKDIDPASDDFFRVIIEARKRAQADVTLSERARADIGQALKIMASSGSYGIFAEINREQIPKGETVPVRVHGLGSSFDVSTSAPESPGEYCFPPLAALITGGARLMLALLERSVADAGGSYAFTDTDSMAIVVSSDRFEDGTRMNLSHKQIGRIVRSFELLNPYDRSVVPGSILEIKEVNYDAAEPEKNRRLGGLWVYAIAAKRYAFFRWRAQDIEIIEASEHGLGHLLNPISQDSVDEGRDWISEFWKSMVLEASGLDGEELSFLDVPAISRISISSPHVLAPFSEAQRDLPFSKRIRPTNFLLSATLDRMWIPAGADRHRFHLLRGFTKDVAHSLEIDWTDIYSGARYQVSTEQTPEFPHRAIVKTFRQILEAYASHPEPKSAGMDGKRCVPDTWGLLKRRHITPSEIIFVGKETNRLEEVQNGLVHDWSEVCAIYRNPELDPWKSVIPELKKIPCAVLAGVAGVSQRAIRSIRNGHSTPSAPTKAALLTVVDAQTMSARKAAAKRPQKGKKGRVKNRA